MELSEILAAAALVIAIVGLIVAYRSSKRSANEVKAGVECGIGVKNYNDVRPGDHIEVFERTEIAREI